jgi:germination protein M
MLKHKIIRNFGLIISIILVIGIFMIYPKKDEYIIAISNNITDLYLLDSNNYVSKVNIEVQSTNTNDLIKEKISLMTKNDNLDYRLRSGFTPPIPKGTKLLDFNLENNILVLNFSSELLNVDEIYEEKMIEAIIYSLTSIDGVDGIIIKVNNETLTKLNNYILPSILDRSFKINKKYDSSSLNNLKEVTIYYTASYDNYNYYVPVTKITDKDTDKIEIIIDELKSSSTYNTNLIEFINEETELINYELIDSTLILNFNDSIFTDINSKTIKEEVIYSINSSINETLNGIEYVLYYVNGNIYNSYCLLLG